MDDWYLVFSLRNGELYIVCQTEDEAKKYIDDSGERAYEMCILKINAELL